MKINALISAFLIVGILCMEYICSKPPGKVNNAGLIFHDSIDGGVNSIDTTGFFFSADSIYFFLESGFSDVQLQVISGMDSVTYVTPSEISIGYFVIKRNIRNQNYCILISKLHEHCIYIDKQYSFVRMRKNLEKDVSIIIQRYPPVYE